MAYYDYVTAACKANGIYFFTGGSPHIGRRRIHVAKEDAPRLLKIMQHTDFHLGYRLKDQPIREIGSFAQYWATNQHSTFDVHVTEYTADLPEVSIFFCSIIEIDFWARKSSFARNTYFEGERTSRAIRRVKESTFGRLLISHTDLDQEVRNLYDVPFDIDIVYTWVNDEDPDWLDSKERFARLAERSVGQRRAHHAERFRSRDELRYSLRSIEQFVPFARRIFLVTAGQRPSWLNVDHPKLTLVDHRDIYKDTSWLPTFNSSGIETQLHHIDGLADKFMYFNDDFFIGRLCAPTDFFEANGLIKFFRSDQIAFEPEIDDSSEEYIKADRNVIDLLKRDFGILARSLMLHAPYPSSRQLLYEMEARYQDAFDGAASQRFRSTDDIRPIAFMQYHYGFHTMRAVPSSISHRYLALWKSSIAAQLRGVRDTRRYKTFCINDVGLEADHEVEVNNQVRNFLEEYFPIKSSFERPGPARDAADAIHAPKAFAPNKAV